MKNLITSNSFGLCLLSTVVAIINIELISLFPIYLYIYFMIILILIFILQKNIVSIYGRVNQSYITGNGYIKRMFSTIGIFNLIIYMLLSIVIYLLTFVNSYLAMGLLIIIILIPFESMLIKAWSHYDKPKYYDIDCQNPGQKKYWIEPKQVYLARTKW